jgi:hypothetical protein
MQASVEFKDFLTVDQSINEKKVLENQGGNTKKIIMR